MREFLKKAQDILSIKTKKKVYRPRPSVMGILSLATGLIALAYAIFCTATHFFIPGISDNGEHLIIAVFSWLIAASLLLLSLDLFYRSEASHVLIVFLGGTIVLAYQLAQGIYRLGEGNDVGNGVVYVVTAVLVFWSLLFFLKKAFDGDASWLMKTSIGLSIAGLVCSWAFSYMILEAFAHANDSLFWDGVIVGILTLCAFVYCSFTSVTSDYDPHPIMVDELGNVIEEKA